MNSCSKLAAMAVDYNIKLSDKQLEELTCFYDLLYARIHNWSADIMVGTM